MTTQMYTRKEKPLPTTLHGLVRLMPPMAIRDDIHHQNTVVMIARLMRIKRNTSKPWWNSLKRMRPDAMPLI